MNNYKHERLVYNGKPFSDFGVWISGAGTFASPERDVEFYKIPGRNGALTYDAGTFGNITIAYDAYIKKAFPFRFDALREYILSLSGYQKLEDSYHPEEYRMAIYKGPLEPDVKFLNKSGEFTLSFECKPQRFLKSGDYWQTFTANGSIYNPALFSALPIIRVYGIGTVGIGTSFVKLTANTNYTDIDCEMQDAYCGSVNCNGNLQLQAGIFPSLHPGENGITLGTGITKVEILPRWWKI